VQENLGFIDLFAGAGGMSLGFESAGVRPLYAMEIDKWASDTYRENHHAPIEQGDICDVTDTQIRQMRDLNADVIIGGPPCQGFSHSNAANKDPRDPRNSLFREFVRFMKILKPRAVVIENVPGLLKTKTEEGKSVISLIAHSFDEIGYSCQWRLLEASAFGVPQQRQRLFIVGIDRDRLINFQWPVPTHGSPEQHSLFDTIQLQKQVPLWDAISDLPQCIAETFDPEQTYSMPAQNPFQTAMRAGAPPRIYNHEPMRHTERIVQRFSEIQLGFSESDVREELRPRQRGNPLVLSVKGYDQNSRRQDPNAVCNTVVASSHTNFIHPFLNRNFTVRELMRIQSFPDRYIAHGKRAVLSKKLSIRKGLVDDIYLDQRSQVGNAVPPLLAAAVARKIIAASTSRLNSNAA
jgi:DNA (cytosine-5)-methyltransferase 1